MEARLRKSLIDIRKSIIAQILSALSPQERKLVLILGLLTSQRVKTRAESELQAYSRERLERLNRGNNMEKNMRLDKLSVILNELGKLNAAGLTREQIVKRLESKIHELRQEIMQKTDAVDPKKPTNEPDTQDIAFYHCPKCKFTVDAMKDLPAGMECVKCGGKMEGLTREELANKDSKNTNLVDEAGPMPRPPKVKP